MSVTDQDSSSPFSSSSRLGFGIGVHRARPKRQMSLQRIRFVVEVRENDPLFGDMGPHLRQQLAEVQPLFLKGIELVVVERYLPVVCHEATSFLRSSSNLERSRIDVRAASIATRISPPRLTSSFKTLWLQRRSGAGGRTYTSSHSSGVRCWRSFSIFSGSTSWIRGPGLSVPSQCSVSSLVALRSPMRFSS